MDYPRYPISEMFLGKFPGSLEFQSWRVNFKDEVRTRTADPQITVQWTEGKWESAFSGKQLADVRNETHAVSVTIPHLETDALRDKKDNRPLLHQKAKAQTDGKIP